LRLTVFALTGGQDKLVNAFEVSVDADGRATSSKTPDYTLLGHEDNISTLDVGPGGAYIVSGSWDKTARIWKGWECVATLKGHLQAVWAVLAVDEERVITGEQEALGPGLLTCY
jgi:phospholipase A-2-activating protein